MLLLFARTVVFQIQLCKAHLPLWFILACDYPETIVTYEEHCSRWKTGWLNHSLNALLFTTYIHGNTAFSPDMINELKACENSQNDNIPKSKAMMIKPPVLWIPMNEHRRSSEHIQDYQANAPSLSISYKHAKLTGDGQLTVLGQPPSTSAPT